jgi:hypothetical protein
MDKFILGKAEIKVIEFLKVAKTNEEIIDMLLSKRFVSSKSSGEKVKKTLLDKKLISKNKIEVRLTDAGALQRNVLVTIGLISDTE